jgi:hypothetical protein
MKRRRPNIFLLGFVLVGIVRSFLVARATNPGTADPCTRVPARRGGLASGTLTGRRVGASRSPWSTTTAGFRLLLTPPRGS